jgi:hypothetical protein
MEYIGQLAAPDIRSSTNAPHLVNSLDRAECKMDSSLQAEVDTVSKFVTRPSRASQMILARSSYRTHRFVLQLRPASNYTITSRFPCATFCTKKAEEAFAHIHDVANSKRAADCVRTPWKPGWLAIRCNVHATSP